MRPGHRLYVSNCASCHGTDRTGNVNSGFPSLLHLQGRLTRTVVANTITKGKGMMPAFTKFSDEEKKAILDFLFSGDDNVAPVMKEPGLVSKDVEGDEVRYEI